MSETEKLEPCPLCSSPHTSVARNLRGNIERAFCKACDCSAPIAAWNRRALPSRDDVLEEAARVADSRAVPNYNTGSYLASDIAAAIRSLKSKDTADG